MTCPCPRSSGALITAAGSCCGPVPCTNVSKGEGRAAGRRSGTPRWALTPSHRPADLRTRWALAWMGLLLCAACILLLLLLKKEDLKGERRARWGCAPLGVLAQPFTSRLPSPQAGSSP